MSRWPKRTSATPWVSGTGPYYAGRDAGRTPMQWRTGPGGGFTAAGVRPWLPLGDVEGTNVESQRSDPDSMLHLARDLIALRRRSADLRLGDYRTLDAPDGVWAWSRGEQGRRRAESHG